MTLEQARTTSARASRTGGRPAQDGPAILGRYALILDTVAQASTGLPLAEIGHRTALPQATVYRLVHALVKVGFLASGERRKQYMLGPRLRRLVHTSVAPRTIRRLAQPILESLAAEFGETAFIAKLEDDAVKTVAVALPAGERQAFVHPGRSMPFHAAASAKAILAFADVRLVDALLAKDHQRFTPHTKTSRQDISAELGRVRQQGFATCDQELDPGVFGYACPIRLEDDVGVVYSVGLVGLADRLRTVRAAEIVSALKRAAAAFSDGIRRESASAAEPSPGERGLL